MEPDNHPPQPPAPVVPQPAVVPHHLSAEEHQLHAAEDELLKDGRLWLKRAADLYTRTPKIKIWVPVAGSILMTVYSLYTIHLRAASAAEKPAVAPAPEVVVVSDEPSTSPQKAALSSASATGSNGSEASGGYSDGSDPELLKSAQQARAAMQFADEANFLQRIFDHSQAPQQVCPAIGKAYERAGEIAKSIQAFEQCMTLTPGNTDTMVAFAHALEAKPDFARATSLLRDCLAKDPKNLDARTGLALIELKQNHLPQASEAATAILHDWPDNTDALLISGVVAWRESRLADAEKIFLKGVALDDHRADFHAFLGRIAEAQRRPYEALQQYQKALALDPADGDIADRRDRLRDMR